MIRPAVVLGIARSEARLVRRLVRYWVFLGLAALLSAATFAQYAFIHWQFSAYSASAAALNPRYLVSSFGGVFILAFLVGIVFLGYDLRARDRRERISEVLDAAPCSNLELLAGRFLGVLVPVWLPVVVILAGLQVVGLVGGWPIEPRSMVGLALFMALPAFAFALALTYLVTLLVRHRLVAALLVLGVLVGSFVLSQFIPLWTLPALDVTGGFAQPFPSDLVSRVTDLSGVAHRGGVLLAALGMLVLAAAVHPRSDDGRRGVHAAVGGVLFLAGAAFVGSQVLANRQVLAKRLAWREVHLARAGEPVVDLGRVKASVALRPRARLEVEAELRFTAPASAPIERALFSFNPGLEVASVTDGSAALEFTHTDGLLEVRLGRALGPGDAGTLVVAASGRLDPDFGYLDATVELLERNGADANMVLLGYDAAPRGRAFAALLPGLRWLPRAGTELSAPGAPRAVDFFEADVTIEVPDGWLVAGPGRREPVPGGETPRFRFAPPAPVPAVALIAGRYHSVATEVDGVVLEVLVHPAHRANLELLAEAGPELHDWLGERLDEARRLGLGYPYGALTLVEVSTTLRGYAGGWRMDTTLAQPALILMRESGFPTAGFASRLTDRSRFERLPGGVGEGMRQLLEAFFENDVNGGNPFVAASRSFFSYQTAASGPGAVPLDFVCEDMTTKLLTDKRGYFSVHFFDRRVGQKFQQAAMGMRNPERMEDTYADVLLRNTLSRPAVWDTVTQVSLADLDPWADPAQSIDVLNLKGGAMAASMLDALGRERAGQLLAALRQRTRGREFRAADLLAAGSDVGLDLAPWLELWIDGTALPGFVVDDARIDRLRDAADGTPRYQTRLRLRNGEAAAGLVRVEYAAGTDEAQDFGASDPIEVAARGAVEVGIVTASPPRRLRIQPYLALNRDPFTVPVPQIDTERIVEAEPFSGVRPFDAPDAPVVAGLIVDDLDPGFAVEETEGRALRVAGRGGDTATDQGLPLYEAGRLPAHWSRAARASAWGKYRRTLAMIRGGSGDRNAVFTAQIPSTGTWTLDYHLPERSRAGRGVSRGTWSLEVVDRANRTPVPLDAEHAEAGWNRLGSFAVAAGDVRVEISNRTEGRVVIADAIRWLPAGGSGS